MLLADGSQTLCEKLQVIINSYRKHVFPLETPDEIVRSVLSMSLLKNEDHMWRMLHYSSRKLHQHCLEIVLVSCEFLFLFSFCQKIIKKYKWKEINYIEGKKCFITNK